MVKPTTQPQPDKKQLGMKKIFIILLMLFTAISIAMAQPTMMTKGSPEMSTQVDNDTLCPEQSDRLYVTITTLSGDIFDHPVHPAVGQTCHIRKEFTTTQSYAWYRWEIVFQDTIIETSNIFFFVVSEPGYIKVTAGDNYGHTGTDSIWFNVKDHISPMEDFIMEIDDDLHAKFFGIATPEHEELILTCQYIPGQSESTYHFSLTPGEWSFKDTNTTYYYDSLWYYGAIIRDTCQPQMQTINQMPGLLLHTKQKNDKWYLDIKTILQGNSVFFEAHHNLYFVYYVYTIDPYGQRHLFHDENGNPLILPSETTQWEIPPDLQDYPFLQCGVAQILDDGSHKLASLSNKVVNPLFHHYDPLIFNGFHVQDLVDSQHIEYCLNAEDSLGVIIYGEPNCPNQSWEWQGDEGTVIQTCDSIVILYNHVSQWLDIVHHGCSQDLSFRVSFFIPYWENPFPGPVFWKHSGETVHLDSLEITEPGNYSITYSAYGCSDTYSAQVFDNVEIHRVSVDLQTNKDKISWQTTPGQAEYINKVRVYCEDGSTYTKQYAQGYFLTYNESDETAHNYYIVGILKNGRECPITSYTKGTIHTSYMMEDGYLRMTWNIPYIEPGAPDELTGFYVCKYDQSTQEITIVERLGASVTEYSCSSSLFSGGKAVVAAVFNNDDEDLSFSNLYTVLAVDENGETIFSIYPNPTQGQFTVEGNGMMHISNILGQEIMVKAIDGCETIKLPQGIYFVKLGGMTRKVVVE